MKVSDVLQSQSLVDDVLKELDDAARDVDSFEYGLPLYDDNVAARFREILYRWLNKEELSNKDNQVAV